MEDTSWKVSMRCFDFLKIYSSKCLFLFIQVFVFIVQPIASLDNKNKHLDE